MKRNLLFLFFALLTFQINAQLVITEISYNPPESGTDSLEYIELYNESNAMIDLAGYVIEDNNADTIIAGTVAAGEYVILAINPSAIQTVLGVSAIEIERIATNNGGERIAISDPSGTLIDEVTYSDDEPWPTFADGTDGGGATIELCDVTSDNTDGANWGAATNNLNVVVNDLDFLGTPGAANTATCEFVPDHIVEVSSNMFSPADITINEGESVRWMNIGGFHNVNGSIATYPDNPEGFTNGSASSDNWIYDFTFTVAGLYDYQCDPHAGQGMVGTVTVVGEMEPTIPSYEIGLVNTVNADGVADSLGTVCRLTGIVHGANLRPSGLQFALIDGNNDAIGVFSGTDLGYTYAEGDMIELTGTITQFNGLTQIEPTEAIFLSGGNALQDPLDVQTLGEDTESRLVNLVGMTIVDASSWLGDGSSFNVELANSNGESVFLRIDSDTEPANWVDPFFLDGSPFNVVGIGGQFDNESPFLQGYQLFPRYNSDFTMPTSTEEIPDAEVDLYPNPVSDILTIESDLAFDTYMIYNSVGTIVSNGAFSTSLDVGALSHGNYIILLYAGEKYATKTFIK